MIKVKFPSSKAIQDHITNDQTVEPIQVNAIHMDLQGNPSSLKENLGNSFANQTIEANQIKSKVSETLTQFMGNYVTDLDLSLLEAVTASLARLTNIKLQDVDMRTA